MSDSSKTVWCGVGIVASIALFVVVVIGPVGIQNKFASWRATAYGSDWLVVQYTGMGDVQNHWELKNSAIHSEGQSDGIYFATTHGVVHLSGHYIYIQNPSAEAKELYLKTKKKAVP